jgi:hypothetical protein
VWPDPEPARAIRMQPQVAVTGRVRQRVREGASATTRLLRPEPPEPSRPARSSSTKRYPLVTRAARGTGDLARARTAMRRTHRAEKRRAPYRRQTGDDFRCHWKWSPEPLRKRENRAVARFLKPSAGLEPATPSLPWQPRARSRCLTQSQSACKAWEVRSRRLPHRSARFRAVRYRVGTLSLALSRRTWNVLAWSAQGALRRQASASAAGDRGDAVVVLVVVQNGERRPSGRSSVGRGPLGCAGGDATGRRGRATAAGAGANALPGDLRHRRCVETGHLSEGVAAPGRLMPVS